ncbi:MAG TPA: hypothetical protein PLY87_31465, partial [Planctomycetaceae bacterium]|nr:hypothetical protein [Planctomycetaceae bacterium]
MPRLKSSIGADSVSGAGEPIASILANTFVKLSPNAQGKLAKAFKELLENKDKPLRVGRDFHSLDLAKLHEVREARFSPQRIARVVRQSSGDNNARVRSAWAPTTTALNLINFECVRQQEDAKDEIFWVGYFYSVDNLKTVYDSLDAAIQNGALAEVCLNVEWKVQGFRSQLYGGIQPGQPIQILNGTLGTAAVYHGFGPWTARLICIEDDDREYEAVGEAIDKVSDCARAIGAFASTVAAISGPTPMGAASAAVASAASYVQLCCDITGAIVDIVNYFDNNDTIGFADFNGRGDYAEEKPRSSLSPASVTKTATAGNRSRGGCYDITSLETLGNVSEEFQRLWRFRQETANAKSVRRNPMGIWGGSGTDKIKIDLSAPADMLIDKGVDYDAKGN